MGEHRKTKIVHATISESTADVAFVALVAFAAFAAFAALAVSAVPQHCREEASLK